MKWTFISVLLLVALPIYYVRELLACLLLFSSLFLLGLLGLAIVAAVAAGIIHLGSHAFISIGLSRVRSRLDVSLHAPRRKRGGGLKFPLHVGDCLPPPSVPVWRDQARHQFCHRACARWLPQLSKFRSANF